MGLSGGSEKISQKNLQKSVDSVTVAVYDGIRSNEATPAQTQKRKRRETKMTNRIYKLTQKAIENEMDWDEAIYDGEIETVEEFEDYEEAVKAFEDGGYDPDLYGVG